MIVSSLSFPSDLGGTNYCRALVSLRNGTNWWDFESCSVFSKQVSFLDALTFSHAGTHALNYKNVMPSSISLDP